MRMRIPPGALVAALLAAAVLAGCSGPKEGSGGDGPGSASAQVPFAFSPPAIVHEGGYEPGIRAGPDGTLVLHAHKSKVAGDGAQMASYAWWSRDGGTTWTPLPSPGGAREAVYAFEGDVAFDDAGHLFFLDNTFADQVVSRWRLAAEGPVWESTVPFAGSDGLDDRPWLEAHGDGQLLLASKTPLVPGPGDLLAGDAALGSYRVYRSGDAGATWTLGRTFADSSWCDIALHRADPGSVDALCMDDDLADGSSRMTLHHSGDGGATWAPEDLGALRVGMADRFPTLEAAPGGVAFGAWIDDDTADAENATLRVLRRAPGGAAEALDVTPFPGAFQRPWACAGPGVAAVAFYGSRDVQTGDGSAWHAYALVAGSALAPASEWQLVLLDPEPVSVRVNSPADFFQCTVGPDGVVHVAYLRESGPPAAVAYDYGGTLLHVKLVAGPNLVSR